jgi:hypothetical protein
MTDREIAMANFKAIAALYHAMTGKPLSLDVETESGTVRIVEPFGVAPLNAQAN